MSSVPSALVLTAAQIAGYAENAGFTGEDLITAVAIALAESSGNPNVYNPETGAGAPSGEGSYGLWQIYLYMHPEFNGMNLYDPQTNANAAYSIYAAAGGFSPWTTYGSGAYESYVAEVESAVSAPAGASAAASSTSVSEASVVPSLSVSTVLWVAAAGLLGLFVLGLFE
jgi:hypothetical protein